MIAWLLGLALAHGPAPAGLEVLAWSDDAACGTDASAPLLVRSNVGLAAWNGGTYTYGCPARWGEAEQALVASSPDGRRLLLAGTSEVYWSEDGGCTAEEVEVPNTDTPVTVSLREDGTGLLLTRDFQGGSGALWSVDGEATLLARWTDFFPDELLDEGGTIWLSGARPTPQLRGWTDGSLGEPLALPEADDLQRLALRTHEDGVFVLAATRLEGRWLWQAGEGGAAVIAGPADAIFGPIAFEGADLAVLDGVLWRDAGEGLAATGTEVDWTCLREAAGVVYACTLEATYVLEGLDPEVRTAVFSLDQLGPPDEACDDVGGACTLDWVHFGGESGWVDTAPATCPLAARTPLDTDTGDTGDGSDGGGGCACDQRGPAPMVLPLLAALGALRRRPWRTR